MSMQTHCNRVLHENQHNSRPNQQIFKLKTTSQSSPHIVSNVLREFLKVGDITLPFIVPSTVLLSFIQPEAETLDFSSHAVQGNL